jgi:hypothetical protein
MSYLRTIFLRHVANQVVINNKGAQSFSTNNKLKSLPDVYGGEGMTKESKKTFKCWHEAVSNRDGSFLDGRVNPSVVFRPPTYFKPWKGEDELKVILTCAAEVFGNSFQYKRQWLSPCGREWALEFETEISNTGKIMNGIDLVSLVSKDDVIVLCSNYLLL